MVPSRPTRSPSPRRSGSAKAGREDGRVRLQKVLAEAGIASRRACEELIREGEVEVDGTIVRSLPCLVDPVTARVEVRGVPVDIRPTSVSTRTVMVFKPRGVVSTNRDPFRRRRAIDIVPHAPGERLYPVGRLDIDSSGLLLLTNDGELANRLTHPRYGVHKGYEVMVAGRLDERALEKLRRGVFLADRRRNGAGRASAERIEVLRRDRDRSILFIELSEGRNRQIRRMLEHLGHDVKRLRRIGLGPLKLSGLKPGEWRELSPAETAALRRAAFGTSRKSVAAPKRASWPKSRPPRSGRVTGSAATGHVAPAKDRRAGSDAPASRGGTATGRGGRAATVRGGTAKDRGGQASTVRGGGRSRGRGAAPSPTPAGSRGRSQAGSRRSGRSGGR